MYIYIYLYICKTRQRSFAQPPSETIRNTSSATRKRKNWPRSQQRDVETKVPPPGFRSGNGTLFERLESLPVLTALRFGGCGGRAKMVTDEHAQADAGPKPGTLQTPSAQFCTTPVREYQNQSSAQAQGVALASHFSNET